MEEEEIAITFYMRMMMILKAERTLEFLSLCPTLPIHFVCRYAYYIIAYASDTGALPPSKGG